MSQTTLLHYLAVFSATFRGKALATVDETEKLRRHEDDLTAELIWVYYPTGHFASGYINSLLCWYLFHSLSLSLPFSLTFCLFFVCLSLSVFSPTHPISSPSNFHRTNAKGCIIVSSSAVTHCVM